jgi:DNA-binding MarR family transcriptional regulator
LPVFSIDAGSRRPADLKHMLTCFAKACCYKRASKHYGTLMRSNFSAEGRLEPVTEFRRSVTRLGRLLSASMPKGDLTPTKLTALGILRRMGPLSANALASRLGILPQSLTRIIADLENEGLVTRTRDARDGREHILEPTTRAVTLMRAEGTRRDAVMREAMRRGLTPVEIDLLFVAARAINKLADAWAVPETSKQRQEEPV